MRFFACAQNDMDENGAGLRDVGDAVPYGLSENWILKTENYSA